MNKTTEQFYVMEYLSDNAGNPFFMHKIWDPQLPDYDIFMSPQISLTSLRYIV